MKSSAFASLAALTISSNVAPGLPKRILSNDKGFSVSCYAMSTRERGLTLNCRIKEKWLLRNYSDARPEILYVVFSKVNTIQQNTSFTGIIEALNKLGNC